MSGKIEELTGDIKDEIDFLKSDVGSAIESDLVRRWIECGETSGWGAGRLVLRYCQGVGRVILELYFESANQLFKMG